MTDSRLRVKTRIQVGVRIDGYETCGDWDTHCIARRVTPDRRALRMGVSVAMVGEPLPNVWNNCNDWAILAGQDCQTAIFKYAKDPDRADCFKC